MSLQFFNAVGKRETKKVDGATVMLEPTRGNFRVYPEVAKLLGLKDGSFVTVQEADVTGEGKMTVFIGKGKDGVVKVDENGQELTDKRGRKIYAAYYYWWASIFRLPGLGVDTFNYRAP